MFSIAGKCLALIPIMLPAEVRGASQIEIANLGNSLLDPLVAVAAVRGPRILRGAIVQANVRLPLRRCNTSVPVEPRLR